MRRLSVLLASAVMALSLIAFAVISGASAAPKQQPPRQPTNRFYGAVDYSKAKGTLFWRSGTSKASVNRDAYDECHKSGATDCVTIVWVYNGWVAVAEGSKFFDVGWGATKQAASKAAVKRCGAGCKATTWGHTDIDPNKRARGGYTLPGP